MFRGIVIVNFDYRLGPIVEAVFPEGVVPKDDLWNLALDIWMGIFSREITEESNQKVYGDMGKLAVISFCENSENYALVAFFDDEDGATVWQIRDALKEVMSRGVERLKKGGRSFDVARSVYDEISGLVTGPRKFPSEVYEGVNAIYNALGAVLRLVDEVRDESVKNRLIGALSELADKISNLVINLALTWGDKEVIGAVLRRAGGKAVGGEV